MEENSNATTSVADNENLIVRTVEVDRSLTAYEAIQATGRECLHTVRLADVIPRGEGNEIEVTFFKLNRYISDDELDKEYRLRGLKPADPRSLAAVNAADPSFADEHPNGTHLKVANGRWCNIFFSLGLGKRREVYFVLNGFGWESTWWFAGIRK